ncbi:phosphate/phosphite/phosphonate ABC transporter substrate-binding protein [Yoonia vestfoldensis]|uniref:ABC transporter, phosphonate, periplasmic substrate-binding protein n=1 Tax=Yoonia vestfoldensis TaxID=245188 RepID=A0A1Y0EA72_9RHOB|nr:PhnD/SsuA/transferrin family substrate-binding protein [Yoonia vestfoldensis]ARU00241.1 ABC transporter, phosphonate, periplasmic substrate-binding protein [Yoonia vestfoldensis]
MIASLPMYLRPANRAAHHALWHGIRDGLRARDLPAPDDLDEDIDHEASWAHPDLVLGQICNLPYRALFRDRVTPIAAMDYALPGCAAGYYNAVFIVHRDSAISDRIQLRGRRMAANALLSQSGYGAAQQWAADQGRRFAAPLVTGSHAASIKAVATGAADFATIDAQTWWMARQDDPLTGQVKVIGTTPASPCMTLITRKGQDPAPYLAAITAAVGSLPETHRQMLGLRGIIPLSPAAYDLPLPPEPEAVLA